jgi:hypothetical protein
MRSSHRLQPQSFLSLAVNSLAGARHFTDSGHGNFAQWFRDSVKDNRVAEEITTIERDTKTSAEESGADHRNYWEALCASAQRFVELRRYFRNAMNESEGNLNAFSNFELAILFEYFHVNPA